MFRAQNTMKKLLQNRWNCLVYNMHAERVINVKPQVDIKKPLKFRSLSRKKKILIVGSKHL